MSRGRLLLVEDRESLRRMLREALVRCEFEVVEASDGRAAVEALEEGEFDLVLTDLKLPGASGLEVLAAARRRRVPIPVVVMTAYGTVQTAVEAMKSGAMDFLEKPVEVEELYRVVDSVVGDSGGELLFELPDGAAIVGGHPRLRAAFRLVQKVAPTESTVLITGESGTGKELFARALHALSPRRDGPFVAVNCAAIPESLLENELFGHERGAYTGASSREEGRFEQARGGTLLLDEIGELGMPVQSKVLRVLEERTFERIGGGRTVRADVRLVATTNRDLDEMVDRGSFRSDLFYRLNVFPIQLPPLRARGSDLPALARALAARAAERTSSGGAPRFDDRAIELLAEQNWPGNVRQLANVMERAVILAEGPEIRRRDLEALLDPLDEESSEGDAAGAIRRALERSDGDKRQAAEALGISYRTLQRRIKELDLEGYPHYR
ncbi:MAG: sigma-54 dependent transcriptional regulator [Thermoanaerobaculia bacterium]|nr:sigma-54 dependent transcriptional regulator [Thermoanaerobaculia bacterium]